MNSISFSDRFIPEHLQEDILNYGRAKLVVAFALPLFIAAISYSILYYSFNLVTCSYILALCAPVAISTPFILKWSKSLFIAGNMVTSILFSILLILGLYTNGIFADSLWWFCSVPILAILLNGARYGAAWAFICTGAITVFYILEMQDYKFPIFELPRDEFATFRFVGLTGLTLIAMIFTLLFEINKTKAFGGLLEVVKIADKIAKGDLTRKIEVTSNDAIGQMLSSLKRMLKNLTELITSVKSASDKVAQESMQLNDSSEQTLTGVIEQKDKISQVAASTSEMSQTVLDIAKNASIIAVSSENNTKIAEDGSSVVSNTIEEVQEISRTITKSSEKISSLGDRSKKIGDIVGVINDIADQTNLLALNAAIEAARAGEHGRGFAVVADEVRKLAEKTAKATKEIRGMIKAIQTDTDGAVSSMDESLVRVESGVRLSTEAGDSLKNIVNSVNDLQLNVQQIASATEEMSAVSEQIGGDIESIAQVSDETATNSENVSAAAAELAVLSSDLQKSIGKFKTV